MFLICAAAVAAVLVAAYSGMPSFGHYKGAYGRTLDRVAVAQRHATDVVTAVNFDYRGFDTLGEEFILFTAVVGVAVLLREQRSEHHRAPTRAAEEHRFEGASHGLRLFTLGAVLLTLVVGLYIVGHGQLTPGGGFQAGVILAAALLIVYLGGEYVAMRRVSPHALVEAAEAAGAAAYGLIGLGGMVFAGSFLENFIGLGKSGTLLSAGTIPLLSLSVGLEVTGAFVLLWTEFLDQALMIRSGR